MTLSHVIKVVCNSVGHVICRPEGEGVQCGVM